MIFTAAKIQGVYIVELEKRSDERGFFARAFCSKEFADNGLETNYPQINMSYNVSKGTIRGLHYQTKPNEEVKLMRCINGQTFNAIVDLRRDSETYLQWFGVILSDDENKMLYVPKGFANGYQALTDGAKVLYATSAVYSPESERGVRWNDPKIQIDWPIKDAIVSEKDASFPDLTQI